MANLLDPNAEAPAKKSRLEQFGAAAPAAMQGNEAISEEAVRRYLIIHIIVGFGTVYVVNPLLMVCSQVPEEEANDHNRLAEEVPVQENWNPECPTGPPSFDIIYC